MPADRDVVIAIQLLAGAIVRHLYLPEGCIIVNFRDMDNPGQVELTAEDGYLIDLHSRYRKDYRDIGAILAHEITHVFLHRHRIKFPEELDNEILTDTTACYLGVGWLFLNAYRVTEKREERELGHGTREIRVTKSTEKLGYLTPEEFGYVLGKRSVAFGERMDDMITSPAGQRAFRKGARMARREHNAPPAVSCGLWQQFRYHSHLRYIRLINRFSGLSGTSREFGTYRFDLSDSVRVIFGCPVCGQRLRVPTEKLVEVQCARCQAAFICKT